MTTTQTQIEVAAYGPGRILIDATELDEVLTAMVRAGYRDAHDTDLRSGYGAGPTAVVAWEPRPGDTPLEDLFDVGVA